MSDESKPTPSEPGWYLLGDGLTPTGPFQATEIQSRIREGQLRPTDLIGSDGMRTWQSAFSVEGILPIPWKAPEPKAETAPVPAQPAEAIRGNIPPVPAGLLVKLSALHEVGTLPSAHYRFLMDILEGQPSSPDGLATAGSSASPRRAPFGEIGPKTAKALPYRAQRSGADEDILDASSVAVLDSDDVLDGIDLGFDPNFDESTDDNGSADDDDIDEDRDAELNIDLDEDLDVDISGDEAAIGVAGDSDGSSFDFGLGHQPSDDDDRERDRGRRDRGDDRDRGRRDRGDDRDRGRRDRGDDRDRGRRD